jgi:hypothetical protein
MSATTWNVSTFTLIQRLARSNVVVSRHFTFASKTPGIIQSLEKKAIWNLDTVN